MFEMWLISKMSPSQCAAQLQANLHHLTDTVVAVYAAELKPRDINDISLSNRFCSIWSLAISVMGLDLG